MFTLCFLFFFSYLLSDVLVYFEILDTCCLYASGRRMIHSARYRIKERSILLMYLLFCTGNSKIKNAVVIGTKCFQIYTRLFWERKKKNGFFFSSKLVLWFNVLIWQRCWQKPNGELFMKHSLTCITFHLPFLKLRWLWDTQQT